MTAGRRTGRGPDVRDEVAELLKLSELLESARLRVFRLHLQSAIRKISPIVVDLAELVGTTIDDVAAAFRPSPQWPAVHLSMVDGPQERSSRNAGLDGGMLGAEASVWFTGSHALSPEQVTCSFTLLNGRIEAMAVIGGASIQTSVDRASILLPATEDDVRLVVGDDADLLPSTDLLSGRGYGIERVDDGFVPGRTLVTLWTGMRDVGLMAGGDPCGGGVSDDGD
ncbi:hypothetical protein SAQ01S_26090 [Sphingomonas aquatilis NBRC 16722]|uniref:Uncharacterized protein n=1 Tax=Sphingomonas aquatilis TaxID=93063 RepID=A0AAW3TV96_9SPHN|nr:hypothetical protein [Sphingomonas aquatilis]MBB3877005.1 hypothetical protein [Sphingomonas aquatilis]GEM72843.1 hypothetical protein SAQ01S_26090 [Sphingomonas aquatilis NBRC 16722]